MKIKDLERGINRIVSIIPSCMPRLTWSDRRTIVETINLLSERIEKYGEENDSDHIDDFGKAKSDLRTDIGLAPIIISKPEEVEKLRKSLNDYVRASEKIIYESRGMESEESWIEEPEEESEEEGSEEVGEGDLRLKKQSEAGDVFS